MTRAPSCRHKPSSRPHNTKSPTCKCASSPSTASTTANKRWRSSSANNPAAAANSTSPCNHGGNHYARARNILHDLHFGNYGGYPLRWIYLALGLGGALLFYSGNRLWLDKRARGGARRDVRILAALTEGSTYGSISGIALILLTARLPLPVARESLAWTCYYLPFLAAIAYAHPKGAASRIPLMRGAGALLCAIPASTLLAAAGLLPFTPRLLPLVDATALAFGLALLAVARRRRTASTTHIAILSKFYTIINFPGA